MDHRTTTEEMGRIMSRITDEIVQVGELELVQETN